MTDDLIKMLNVHVEGVRHYLHLQIGKPLSKDLVSAPEIALDNLQREVSAAMRDVAQAVVKPLPWDEINRDRGDGGQDLAGWEADSGFGPFYEIEVGCSSFEVSYDCTKLGDFDDPDQAKKCAQDHFEKAVRSALTEGQSATAWKCLARCKAACAWPDCGCDPEATKVIAALVEQGWQPPDPTAQPSTGRGCK